MCSVCVVVLLMFIIMKFLVWLLMLFRYWWLNMCLMNFGVLMNVCCLCCVVCCVLLLVKNWLVCWFSRMLLVWCRVRKVLIDSLFGVNFVLKVVLLYSLCWVVNWVIWCFILYLVCMWLV